MLVRRGKVWSAKLRIAGTQVWKSLQTSDFELAVVRLRWLQASVTATRFEQKTATHEGLIMTVKQNLDAIASSIIAGVVTSGLGWIFTSIDTPKLLMDLWQRLFVGPWFVWLGLTGVGLYWFVRFLMNLRKEVIVTKELAKQTDQLLAVSDPRSTMR